jgi:hypothetical protein
MNAIFQDVISESASTVLSDTFPNPRKRVATRPPRATMRAATAVMALGLLASAVTTLTPAFAQTTLTVTSTLDYGGPATSGTLRQVLEYQSINCYGPFSPFTINFNIAGGGPHTFQPSSAYPAISCDSTVINGYSQPGATANSTGLVVYSTTPSGNDANIQIILNGISAGSSRGLTITGNTVTVKGLAIRSFQQEGIFVTGNSALIQGNYIGTDPGGMNGYGNGFAGIKVAGGSGTQIGGGGAAGTNLITGNTFASVQVFAPATNFKVWSNMLGGDRSGGGAISGGGNGAVEIIASPCASPVAMGGDVYGNRIRYNAGSGVYIDDCASNNNVSESVIALNVSKAINTNTSGNSGLVKPSITSVAYSASGTSIAGTYTAVISGNHRIDLYGNPTPPTVSEAQYYVPSSSYSANAPSTGPGQPFTVSNSAIVPNPAVTLTRNTIGTSELSDLYRTPFSFSPGSGVNAILPAFTAFSGTAGGATQYQTISVTNTSGSTISWGATPLTLTGDTARFTVASGPTPCASSTSGPSGACDIKIGFASATSGTYNAVATFSVIHNGIESKVEVALTGTASGGGPIFTVSGAPTFPNTAVNGRSDFQTVTVTNTGSANLNISSIGLNNPAEFGDSYFGDIRPLANTGYAWCGLGSDATGAPAAGSRTLPPGQYCTLYLYFKPTSTGLRSGTLTFVTDASPSVQTIELSGGGVIGNAPTVPGTPTATAYNGYALVSFSGSSSPDGRVGYTVVSNPPGGFDSNAGSSNTAHIITGLSNGTAYTFTVQASNGAGTSISPASNSVTPTTPSASLPKPVSQSNLLAYYPFSGSSADAMGGSPYSIGAATLTGGSLSLGGTADYANTSANLDGVGYKSFSVSVDFNMNASFAGGPVVVLGPSYRSLEFGVDSSLNPRLAWSNVGSGYTAPSTGQTAFTGTTLAKGVWYRGTVVVDVYSATPSISLYIDGALVGSVVSPTLPNNFMFDAFYSDANAYDRVFSFVNGANGGAFKGLANNLLVYGTALTGGEVASLNSALGAMGSSLNPTASPTSLVFDDTAVGTDSVAKKVTVANPNASPLPILGVYVTAAGGSQPDFTFDVSACTGSQIPALGTCDIYVKFTPQSATEFPSELNINTAASPLVVPLSGISWPYSMEDSGGVTFAPTPVGGSAGPLTMTFTNLSLGAAIVNAVSLSGTNPADFSITANTCVNPGVLAASDGTCSVDITFTPLSSGAKSATVTLQQGGVSFISSVISGDAVAGLTPAPSSINFGSVTSGASSAVTTVTITKDSSVGCIDWNAPTITGAGAANFAVASNTCTGSFTGTTCTIGLRFDATGPAAVKTATASISGAFDTGCYSLTAVAPIEPELKSARRITAKSGPLYTASIALSGTVLSSGAAPALTSGTPAGGLVGQAYSFGFTASGTGPITWSIVSGSLPPGLTLNSSTGAITGTPTVAGTSTFTIRATNSAGQANLATSITITADLDTEPLHQQPKLRQPKPRRHQRRPRHHHHQHRQRRLQHLKRQRHRRLRLRLQLPTCPGHDPAQRLLHHQRHLQPAHCRGRHRSHQHQQQRRPTRPERQQHQPDRHRRGHPARQHHRQPRQPQLWGTSRRLQLSPPSRLYQQHRSSRHGTPRPQP